MAGPTLPGRTFPLIYGREKNLFSRHSKVTSLQAWGRPVTQSPKLLHLNVSRSHLRQILVSKLHETELGEHSEWYGFSEE